MLLSGKLVQAIEEHAEGIANTMVQKVRTHPDLPALAKRPTEELKAWCRNQVDNLSSSLLVKGEGLKRRYRMLGGARFEESIPLHEAVLRLVLLKDSIIDLAREQGLPMTALDMYALEELEVRICHFFDVAVYHVVCGYEEASAVHQRMSY